MHTLGPITLVEALPDNQCSNRKGIWIDSNAYLAWWKRKGEDLSERKAEASIDPTTIREKIRVAKGQLDLEALKTSNLPTLELRKELISSVGAYATTNLNMILGRHDFIPINSYGQRSGKMLSKVGRVQGSCLLVLGLEI